MELDSVLELKGSIEKSLKSEARRRGGAQAEALVSPKTEARLSVGYSQKSSKDYQLELRLQRPGGKAQKQAEQYKDQAKGEANIEIIPLVEIPSRTAALENKEATSPLRTSKRPLHIGLSVGPSSGGSGTLGAFVVDEEGTEYIMSNNHVFSMMGQLKKSEPIYQPGSSDQRLLRDSDSIASLFDSIVLAKNRRNSIDCSIAALIEDMDHDLNTIPTGLGYPMDGEPIVAVESIGDVELGKDEAMCKIGRTTGFTEGRLSAVALDNVTVRTPIGNLIFDNLLEITWPSTKQPFSLPGDSGSLVFTKKGRLGIGLHFAGGTKVVGKEKIGVSFSCDLPSVLKALGVTLMDG